MTTLAGPASHWVQALDHQYDGATSKCGRNSYSHCRGRLWYNFLRRVLGIVRQREIAEDVNEPADTVLA